MVPASIIKLEKFQANRGYGTVVCASGGFDPIHPGHVSYLIGAANLGDRLVVVVNGDDFLTRKKGAPFMPLKDRCEIVAGIRAVDLVIPFTPSDPNDDTVNEALRTIKPDIFAKGGDRVDEATIPEWDTCKENAIKVETGVGWGKSWSSSNYLSQWAIGQAGRYLEGCVSQIRNDLRSRIEDAINEVLNTESRTCGQ